MKVTRRQLRKLIRESLVKHHYSKFKDRFNQDDRLKTAGILYWAENFADNLSVESLEWLIKEIYESIRSSSRMPIKSRIATGLSKTLESNPAFQNENFIYKAVQSFVKDVKTRLEGLQWFTGNGFRFTYDSREGGNAFEQFSIKKGEYKKRGNNSAKIYYTIRPLVVDGKFDRQKFTDDFKKILTNFGLQLSLCAAQNNIDLISFKTWSSMIEILRSSDDIVVYADDIEEAKIIDAHMSKVVAALNPKLTHIQILTADERRELGRVVYGTDVSPADGSKGTSDTDAAAHYIFHQIVSNSTNLTSLKDWAMKTKNSKDVNSAFENLKQIIDPLILQYSKLWIDMDKDQKVAAYNNAISFIKQG